MRPFFRSPRCFPNDQITNTGYLHADLSMFDKNQVKLNLDMTWWYMLNEVASGQEIFRCLQGTSPLSI